MANTSPVYARIDSNLKKEAEEIMNKLGITPTSLITMVYSQIVLNKELPFKPKLPKHPLCLDNMTQEELEEALEKGHEDIANGRTVSEKELDAILKDKYGI